jgi:hypothetical protein
MESHRFIIDPLSPTPKQVEKTYLFFFIFASLVLTSMIGFIIIFGIFKLFLNSRRPYYTLLFLSLFNMSFLFICRVSSGLKMKVDLAMKK